MTERTSFTPENRDVAAQKRAELIKPGETYVGDVFAKPGVTRGEQTTTILEELFKIRAEGNYQSVRTIPAFDVNGDEIPEGRGVLAIPKSETPQR